MTQIGAIFTRGTPALPLRDYPEKLLSPVTLATLATLETDSAGLCPTPTSQRLAHGNDKKQCSPNRNIRQIHRKPAANSRFRRRKASVWATTTPDRSHYLRILKLLGLLKRPKTGTAK